MFQRSFLILGLLVLAISVASASSKEPSWPWKKAYIFSPNIIQIPNIVPGALSGEWFDERSKPIWFDPVEVDAKQFRKLVELTGISPEVHESEGTEYATLSFHGRAPEHSGASGGVYIVLTTGEPLPNSVKAWYTELVAPYINQDWAYLRVYPAPSPYRYSEDSTVIFFEDRTDSDSGSICFNGHPPPCPWTDLGYGRCEFRYAFCLKAPLYSEPLPRELRCLESLWENWIYPTTYRDHRGSDKNRYGWYSFEDDSLIIFSPVPNISDELVSHILKWCGF